MERAPYQPPRITPEAARFARVLARRRPPLAAVPLSVEFGPAPSQIDDPVRLVLALGGQALGQQALGEQAGQLTLPRRLLERLLARLDPAAVAAGPEAACLLLELALEPVLTRLEAGRPELSVRLSPAPASAWLGELQAGLHCRDGDDASALLLDLSAAAGRALADALERMPALRLPMPGLPVPVRVRAMATDLPLAALRSVGRGDVILADAPGPAGETLLVAGERICWRARRDGRNLAVISPRLPARAAGLGDWMMTDDSDGAEAAARLDELPVRLVCELGRLELPLAELEAIGPGHVFELPRDAAEPVDIMAQGRRIGRGHIVAVGDSLGVQVVWIGQDG